jgi:hypothetical protein
MVTVRPFKELVSRGATLCVSAGTAQDALGDGSERLESPAF